MPKVSKEEKLEKIIEQINNENEAVKKAKEKIQLLNAKKKKLEQQIQNEKYAELKDVLYDYGIKTVADFQNFIDNYSNPQTDKNYSTNYENANDEF